MSSPIPMTNKIVSEDDVRNMKENKRVVEDLLQQAQTAERAGINMSESITNLKEQLDKITKFLSVYG